MNKTIRKNNFTLYTKSGIDGAIASSVMALGTFDGMHLGHQALIAATAKLAAKLGRPSLVLTFKEHPQSLLGSQSFKYVLGAEEEK